MNLKERIDRDLKDAMRSRNTVRLRTLRSIRAALLEKEIAERKGGEADLTEKQMLAVLQKQAKQRRDSIDQYDKGGRNDLVAAESAELKIIESYLPEQLGDEDIRAVVQEIVKESGAASMADMGKVMGPAMQRLGGQADGKRVNQIVREILQS
jgi:uncharacterized protein YqeY